MNTPIIFIHYGDCGYLKYTLKSAKLFNPEKRVILIGDKTNKYYSQKYNIEHYFFDDYSESKELAELKKAYKIVGGNDFERMNKSKGSTDWTKFNFIKWGVLFNFVISQKIEKLWTFDSDTLIISDLKQKEKIYNLYDYTVINSENTMQGLVNNVEFLRKFIILAEEMLRDNRYLDKLLKTDFKINPTWGFTMMRVFNELYIRENPKIIHLKETINRECFDECICVSFSKETNNYFIGERKLNKYYFDCFGNLYNYDLIKKEYNILWGINLSWVPDYVFATLYKISKNKIKFNRTQKYNIKDNKLNEVKYKKPISIIIRRVLSYVCKIFRCRKGIRFSRRK